MNSNRYVVAAALALAAPAAAAQAFRMTDLDLRDPHVFAEPISNVCVDFTDNTTFGTSFNAELAAEITGDEDGDGFLDLSIVAEFLPLDTTRATNFVNVGLASCTAPAAGTTCSPPASSALSGDAAIQTASTCLAPFANTVRPYAPAVISPGPTCFRSVEGDVTLMLGGIPITLRQAAIAATFSGSPTDALTDGLLRGFVTEADADATIIPSSYPLIGGRPLSSILPGGANACAAHDDRDTIDGTPGGTRGWWFYLNYTASQVTLAEDPFADGFRDSFEDPVP